MQIILNIGLDGVPVEGQSFTNGVRNPSVIERMFAAHNAVRAAGFRIVCGKPALSGTEPTLALVVVDDRPGLDNRIDMLAVTLKQDAIAVYYPDEQWGLLIGPDSDARGSFNPARFILPDGVCL